MPLSLPDEYEVRDRFQHRLDQWMGVLQDIVYQVQHYKLMKITVVHWAVLGTWVALLLHFTSVYRVLYQISALAATMCTNVLLFGTSDCLAQCILCFMSFKVDPVPRVVDDMTRNIVAGITFGHLGDNRQDDAASDDLSVFNDYGIESRDHEDSHGVYASNQGWEHDSISDTDAESDREVFNFYNWMCFMFWGWFLSFFQVPWYKFLNYFYTEDPTFVQVLERVLSDQLVYSPISLYCFFMYSNYIMEHGDAETFQIKIQRIYISTLGCNYLVWPLVQFINFLLVPKHLQVPFSSSVGVLWNCFLSMRNTSNSL